MTEKIHITPVYGIDIYITLDHKTKNLHEALHEAFTKLKNAEIILPKNIGYVGIIKQKEDII